MLAGRLPRFGKGLLPPTSRRRETAEVSGGPTLLDTEGTKETKGTETEVGQLTVTELLVPSLDNSVELPCISDMVHHIASGKGRRRDRIGWDGWSGKRRRGRRKSMGCSGQEAEERKKRWRKKD